MEPPARETLTAAMSRVQGESVRVEAASPELPDCFRTLRALTQLTIRQFTGRDASAAHDLTPGRIAAAKAAKTAIYHRVRRFRGNFDALALPVVGGEPGPVAVMYPAAVVAVVTRDDIDWLRFSFLAMTAELPALSLPCGMTAPGQSVGLQLTGARGGKARLLQVGLALEQRIGWDPSPFEPKAAHLLTVRP